MSLLQVLGLEAPGVRAAAAAPARPVRFEPVTQQLPAAGSALRITGRPRSDAVIAPPPAAAAERFATATGKEVEVARTANGRVRYTAPPPKVAEVTFSGGGGKGTALPGAVKALYESGVLKDAKTIAGASVGSMTAAVVAAGITPAEFLAMADADATTKAIDEGTGGSALKMIGRALTNKVTTGDGSPLTGNGLEGAVRAVLDVTLRKRMAEYVSACAASGKPPDPVVATIAERLAGAKTGPTFGDYRALSKVMPSIKEVVISGTYTKEFTTTKTKGGKETKTEVEGGNQDAQLYIFDADTEPDLAVAVAVHASASFPGVFKPVDIKIASGMVVRFVDGGVMNNTPTAASVGNGRDLDPMPQERGVTFVFEEKTVSADMLKGKATPAQGLMARLMDWGIKADNAGAEYGKNKSAAAHASEVVVVPLQITLPPKKKGGKGTSHDLRGLLGGTLNFSPPQDVRDGLRGLTEEATRKQIAADAEPRTREFASDAQMFVSIPLDELKALADSGYAGAKDAHAFRAHVAEMVDKLRAGAAKAVATKGGRAADALKQKDVSMALEELDRLAGGEVEFQGYVGRELNKCADLDVMLEAARRDHRKSGKPSPTMDATDAVAEALRAHTFGDNIVKQLVRPKMKQEPDGGAGIHTLLTIEQLLLVAKTPADVNQAIDVGVTHFLNKRDRRIPKRGHRRFAQQLDQRRMRPAS